jgi:hypothetical protein
VARQEKNNKTSKDIFKKKKKKNLTCFISIRSKEKKKEEGCKTDVLQCIKIAQRLYHNHIYNWRKAAITTNFTLKQ